MRALISDRFILALLQSPRGFFPAFLSSRFVIQSAGSGAPLPAVREYAMMAKRDTRRQA
jgi:hypothetical protein